MSMSLLASFALAASLSAPAGTLAVDRGLLNEAADLLSSELSSQQAGLAPMLLDVYGPSVAAQKANKAIGVGLQVGTPTALTLKFPGSGNADIVLGIGLGLGYDNFGRAGRFGLSIHGDYLFTLASLVNNGTLDLSVYAGPGIWVVVGDRGYGYFGYYSYAFVDTFGLGVRVPVGLAMSFTAAPIEVYLELDPAIFVFPGIGGFLGASLGFRWFF